MSAILLLLLVLPGPLHITYLAWSYITPCLIFDFGNFVYLCIRIVFYFKNRGSDPAEESALDNPAADSKEFIALTNDIGAAHIQTVKEVNGVEDLSQGHNETPGPVVPQ